MKKKVQHHIEAITQVINQAADDIRAEALLASFLANHQLAEQEFIAWHDGSFKRRFNKDINTSKLVESITYDSWLQVHMSRNGLYDILPEGLFFQPGETLHHAESVPEMVQQYRHDQQQEKEIRLFFQPYEHAFFQYKLKNEQEESLLLKGLHSGIHDDYFIEFWNLPRGISHKQALALILLLPYAHIIAGDMDLMPLCLEKILGEHVKASAKPPTVQLAKEQSNILGSFELGSDLVCGEMFDEDFPVIEFSIGVLKHSAEQDYLPGGAYYDLIQAFTRYFIPVHAEVITTIVLGKPDMHNRRLKANLEPVLGMSALL